uniref:ZP domain-containing protein n=1 Tax=Bursaphelenchus xylophilus TaxID=6326 RepID=A0A1I7RVS2_BURXY
MITSLKAIGSVVSVMLSPIIRLLFFIALCQAVRIKWHYRGSVHCENEKSLLLKVVRENALWPDQNCFSQTLNRAEVFSLSIVGRLSNPNHCGDFLVSEDRSFDLVCDDGPLASKFYVPRVFIYHSCDGHCHEFEVRDKFVFEMELSAEGRTRPPIFCSQQVY